MNLAIPRKKNSEMLLYFWKIIDLSRISRYDFLYKISFHLFLFSPEEAIDFMNMCLKNKILIEDENEIFSLSDNLTQKLKQWQRKRRDEIQQNLRARANLHLVEIQGGEDPTSFNFLLKKFVEKGTLNRAVMVSDSAFDLKDVDEKKTIIKSNVLGSTETSYIIEINTIKKKIYHNCHDFETRRSRNKQFCKHLVKFFLLLRTKNQNYTEILLRDIVDNIDKWEFIS
ncbi:hypothetical protein LCGC14_0604420 [marine sediment metagenome]|uniref:SWIM-type domain-containing protein n=1 Tax=marine sediment metagenome TaxID=412755 RepID=A0A0F9RTJ5_9ZZZZ|nr:MAG: hypothetical protein Lokiarch_35640 [Candidatus Lokiarchaeum sp. GC14_75]